MKIRANARRGFTLAETMISAVLVVVVGGVALNLLIGGFTQFARNVALNQSAQQSRATLNTIVRRLESAIDTPQLVTLSSGALVASSGTYAPGVRFHRIIGGAYKITDPVSVTQGSGSTALSYTSASTTTLTLTFNGAWPAPRAGDRVMFLNPSDIRETVATGTSPGEKPGRRISAVGSVTGTNPKTVTVTLGSAPGKQILCGNPCYILREAALVAVDVSGRRQLRYYDYTGDLNSFVVVARDLDPLPRERDASGTIIQPFGLTSVNGHMQVLCDVPVRINEYQATLTRLRQTDEFNGFLRTGSSVVLKSNFATK
jgi:type II secretory pathway pseudopilin PulG